MTQNESKLPKMNQIESNGKSLAVKHNKTIK